MIIPFRTANTPLEVLRIAEANLLDKTTPFRFEEWSRCTCGHIYSATYKSAPPRRGALGLFVVAAVGKLYRDTLRLILKANEPSRRALDDDQSLALHVSDLTRLTRGSRRANALAIVQTTIAYELDRQNRDRMNILRSLGELDAGHTEHEMEHA